MAINPKKVLLIRNTNSAVASLSSTVSDWYAVARDLTETSASDYFWMGFDFGVGLTLTTAAKKAVTGSTYLTIDGSSPITCASHSSKITSSQVGVAALQAIKNVINTYGIEAVFVLPGVPSNLDTSFTQYPQYIELYLASLGRTTNVTAYSGNLSKSTDGSPGVLFNNGSGSGFARARPNHPLGRVGGGAYDIYCGRIGAIPSASSDAAGASTLSQVQQMVNNAKAAELVNNLGNLHILGGSAYIYSGGVLSSTAVNYLGYDMGVSNLSYIVDGIQGIGYAEEALWPVKPLWKGSPIAQLVVHPTRNTQIVQAYGGGKVSAFSLMSPRIEETAGDSYCTDRLDFVSGGFAYAWMSAARATQEYALLNGGSLGFGCASEPFSNNLPDTDALLYLLYLGQCGSEACYRARQDWTYTGASVRDLPNGSGSHFTPYFTSAHGDPLYAPYKFTAPKIMQVGN